jgi:hypothetical protein
MYIMYSFYFLKNYHMYFFWWTNRTRPLKQTRSMGDANTSRVSPKGKEIKLGTILKKIKSTLRDNPCFANRSATWFTSRRTWIQSTDLSFWWIWCTFSTRVRRGCISGHPSFSSLISTKEFEYTLIYYYHMYSLSSLIYYYYY